MRCSQSDLSISWNPDPNRKDDDQYIVRLVGQVVQVSLDTVAIVDGLPDDFGG